MMLRVAFITAALLTSSSLAAAPDLTGIWTLNGPGTESEILLTEEGLRIQSEYDLLVDDPSLFCVPASASRIWANPGARILIQQSEEAVLIILPRRHGGGGAARVVIFRGRLKQQYVGYCSTGGPRLVRFSG